MALKAIFPHLMRCQTTNFGIRGKFQSTYVLYRIAIFYFTGCFTKKKYFYWVFRNKDKLTCYKIRENSGFSISGFVKTISKQLIYSFILNILELTTSCRLLQNKNPRDPWTNQGPIPLPDNEKMDKFLHYDQDTRPGCEEWHDPVGIPFSGKNFNCQFCQNWKKRC